MSAAAVRVAIIGGGFAGAAVAAHLAVQARRPAAIEIVEPRATLGAGLAYSTSDPAHRINVPSSRMNLFPEDEGHFDRWLRATGEIDDDPDAVGGRGDVYARRATFGRYVDACVRAACAGGPVTLRHVRDLGRSVEEVPGGGYAIGLASGVTLAADVVVLAAGNPPPEPPAALARALAGHAGFVPDPWAGDALERIGRRDRVLIVGTALTMADIVATLGRLGHEGPITAVSRRGLASRGHAPRPFEPFGDFTARPAGSARELLARVRLAVRMAEKAGLPWQAVFDRLRRQGQEIWAVLPLAERRRFLRHLRPYWDTHRYRIAPQVDAALAGRRAAGTLEIRAASLGEVRPGAGGIAVQLRPRGQAVAEERDFDAVVVATGPAHGALLRACPLVRGLAEAGLVAADPTGLGLLVDRHSRALDGEGRASDGLLVAGPLARGTFGELMGATEIATHAAGIASRILARGDRNAPAHPPAADHTTPASIRWPRAVGAGAA